MRLSDSSFKIEVMESCHLMSVAPMIQWTDRHWRYLFRGISRKTLLYTEMTMDSALIYNTKKLEPFIGFSDIESPLALQLGGNDPAKLGQAASICEGYASFQEINLNCGCPSNKAKKAGFGAELMLEPDLVGRILYEMKRQTARTDITVKCRLGVTGRESWEELMQFMHTVSASGVRKVVVHARSCVLKGLSPAQNRTIPPLNYDWVHRLVSEFPELKIVLNGGVETFEDSILHLGSNYPYLKDNSSLSSHSSYHDMPSSASDPSIGLSEGAAVATAGVISASFSEATGGIKVRASDRDGCQDGVVRDMNDIGVSASTSDSVDSATTSHSAKRIKTDMYSSAASLPQNATADERGASADEERGGGELLCGFSCQDDCDTAEEAPTGEACFKPKSRNGRVTVQYTTENSVHGIMIGREAYRNPFLFSTADSTFFGCRDSNGTRRLLLEDYLKYAERMQDCGAFGSSTCNILKPLHHFFHGAPHGANHVYKQHLDEALKVNVNRNMNKKSLERLVMDVVEATIPIEFLDMDIIPRKALA